MGDVNQMKLDPLWKGSELLHRLLADFLFGRIETRLFCSNFEEAFNFGVDRNALTPKENDAFQKLFDEVVYFSPFPEEVAKIPIYRSEVQIREAARATQARLAPKT